MSVKRKAFESVLESKRDDDNGKKCRHGIARIVPINFSNTSDRKVRKCKV
jgi:hypothetical protein